jgi:hypothetical protein
MLVSLHCLSGLSQDSTKNLSPPHAPVFIRHTHFIIQGIVLCVIFACYITYTLHRSLPCTQEGNDCLCRQLLTHSWQGWHLRALPQCSSCSALIIITRISADVRNFRSFHFISVRHVTTWVQASLSFTGHLGVLGVERRIMVQWIL